MKELVDELCADKEVSETDRKDILRGWIQKLQTELMSTTRHSTELAEVNYLIIYIESKLK